MGASLLKILGMLLVGYGIFVILLAGCQRALIYHPSRAAEDRLLGIARQAGMEPWQSSAGTLHGWRQMGSAGAEGATAVMVFQGNAGYALHRAGYGSVFRRHGGENWHTFLLEYPGYGARSGRPSETHFQEAAEQAFQDLLEEGYQQILLLGESLGSGVACALAADYPDQVAGLLLITPFTKLADVGRAHYPFLPVNVLLRDRFDNRTALQSYEGPVAILLAGEDEVVPAHLGRRLYEEYTGPKQIWVQEYRNHNTLDLRPDAPWWAEAVQFLKDN